jgi:hypothetical protein
MKKLLFLLTLSLLASAFAEAAQEAMIYRYWDWGKTPKRDDYQVAALRLALEKTQDEYGAFTIIRNTEAFTISRLRREVNRGEIVNIQAAPWRPNETNPAKISERSLKIEVPLLKGLLGYRQLIIRKTDAALFNGITSTQTLQKLTAGLARGWQDADIFRHNGYKVDDSADFPSMFFMLSNKRFDYLPMSMVEAQSALNANPKFAAELMVAPNIVIYYPFPIVFYVSEKQPLLADRLSKGLMSAEKDGTLDKLFSQYFAAEIEQVKNQKPRCFVLANPYIPENLNQRTPLLFDL